MNFKTLNFIYSLCGIYVFGCLHLWNVDSNVCLGSRHLLQLVLQPIRLHCYHWLRLRSVLGQLPWTRGKFWPLCPQGFEIAQSIQSYKVSIKGTTNCVCRASKKLETAHYLCLRLESCLMKLVAWIELETKRKEGSVVTEIEDHWHSLRDVVCYACRSYVFSWHSE